ncbi:hypothetical protein BRD19_10175 [Halobacteriales archaeon SW_7_65_23]|nr:MAG: hypothetical protein BRD19_10175 [Halobacteriales archaeon SW_7_65_23]
MSSQQQARTNSEPPTDDAASLASAAADDMELGEAQEEDGPEPAAGDRAGRVRGRPAGARCLPGE